MKHLRVDFAVTLCLLLCQTAYAGHPLTSKAPSVILVSVLPYILGPLGQESAKLALLGFIFVAVRRAARHKSSGPAPIQPRPSMPTIALDVLTQKCPTNNSGLNTKRSNPSAVIEEERNANSAKMEPNSVADDNAYPRRDGSSAAVRQ